MDTHQQGKIISAYGTGPSFPKEGGLGQGSVLAPLKWILFMDPLLHELDKIGDPYQVLDPTSGTLTSKTINL